MESQSAVQLLLGTADSAVQTLPWWQDGNEERPMSNEDQLFAKINALELKIEELEFELSESQETIREMDMQPTFFDGFIDYLQKAGHWGYIKGFFNSYLSIMESRKEAATEALRNFIFEKEGRGDLF